MINQPDTIWTPSGPTVEAVYKRHADPLRALSEADIPAILLPNVFPIQQCKNLVERFLAHKLMVNPKSLAVGDPTRIDIGTSLGNYGNNREDFFTHSAATHELFATLFDGFDNPISLIYESLRKLACGRQVATAHEPDGRRYGPAIFRIHYESHSYKPHIDHVTLREKRFDYAVTQFEHQFAGVLCIQNAKREGKTTQALLHRCLWTEDIQPFIEQGTFREYATKQNIVQYQVNLSPGDLYFFNTRCIHEVPPVVGVDPRIVLAVFIGFSTDNDQIFVWA